jgi:hypothetical protein
MSRRIIGSVIGALAVAGLAAPVAHAGAPAKVTVRVVGPSSTLAAATLTTTTKPVVKDGIAAHACSGTSAAGALEQATHGKWTASYFSGLGYAVDTIGGVKPAGFDYWTLWIDGKASMTGLCDSELQPGDQVLEFVCHDATAPDYACKNRPLALIGPKGRVRPGHAFGVRVVTLKDDGTTVPAPGVTIHGGASPVKADANGRAQVVLAAGESALRATRAGDVPSAPLDCAIGSKDGSCGSSDRTAPSLAVAGIKAGETFAAKHAPRELRGVARDPGGVTVALRLTRRAGKRCATFDAKRGAFRACNPAKRAPLFDVGSKVRWSYLLPAKLAPGAYVLDVRATDGAGNRRSLRIRFRVGGAG